MSSCKHLCVALCALIAALPVRAEKPNDNSRANDSSQRLETRGVTKEVGGKSLEEWRKDLTHPDPSIRASAIVAIVNFQQASEAVADIVKRLQDTDADPRVKAALALRMIQVMPTDRLRVVQALGHVISRDPQSVIRYEAAATLRTRFLPLDFKVKEERDVLQDLVAGLSNTTTYALRDICIDALIYAGVDPKTGPDPRVTDALLLRANLLYESTTQVRLRAIMALGVMGRPQDPKKLADVIRILKLSTNYNSSHPQIRIWSHVAIIALGETANKKELDTIAGYLKNREAAIKVQAVLALGALEEKAEGYVGDICALIKNEKDNSVREAAARSLGNMKTKGEKVLNSLISLTELDDTNSIGVVLNACNALRQIGANDAQSMMALEKVLKHNSLAQYQKDMVQQMIDDIKNPKKPVKAAPKKPEKVNGRPQQPGR
ncbi:MAG: HEAT repeat domain-containing protein [Gemmataceae bacterium]